MFIGMKLTAENTTHIYIYDLERTDPGSSHDTMASPLTFHTEVPSLV